MITYEIHIVCDGCGAKVFDASVMESPNVFAAKAEASASGWGVFGEAQRCPACALSLLLVSSRSLSKKRAAAMNCEGRKYIARVLAGKKAEGEARL